ncbi:uncharacterized protein EV154DRAFT_440100 [Mucor mucedo]|uniref:uncharacterized protein n=1 Tax=Mucor mucedo TaxID=29922 RepID=UPI00221FCD03|nr:uncharacterized protein EV154DRAFT_440100 [Mucor mucedo]KAI7893255.1 hypothetical protein EV154DRAFT_440100 [Mucor mucedo]
MEEHKEFKATSSKKAMKHGGKNSSESSNSAVPDFIQKLFRMLENKAFKDVFCWDPSGTTFLVKDTNEFSKSILPKHFKHCNFASFVRQLNKYDFHKIRSNADETQKLYGDQTWEFEHANFKRDRKDLLEEIKRKTPGKKKKTLVDSSTESPSPILPAVNSPVIGGHEPTNTLADLRKLTRNLQSQVNQLKQSQIELEATVNKMDQNDKLIMAELSGFQENLKKKDEIIRECLKLTVNNKPPPEPTVKIEEDATSTWTEQSTIPIESILTDLFLPTPPQSSIDTASIAAAAAQLNGGSLIGSTVKGADGGLTVYKLNRLNAKEEHVPTPPSDDIKGKKKMVASWTTPPRVLLVDDDSVYRDVSGRMLNMIGCSIDLAKDGLEALQKMSLEKYDLILMDIVMPKMDGIATTRNIRRYDSLTPIVSMTSNFTHNDIMEYIGIGMNDILPKPFSKSTLYDILEKHCAHLKIMKRQQTTADEILIPRGSSSSSGGLGQANITPLLDDNTNTYPYNTPIADTPSTSSSSSSPTNHSPTNTSNRTTTSSSSTVTTAVPSSTATAVAITTPTTTTADSNYWQPIDNRKLVWSSSVQQKYPPQQQSKRQKLNDLYDPPF